MKFYRNFNEMFDAQSGIKNDVSVFNDSDKLNDVIKDSHFEWFVGDNASDVICYPEDFSICCDAMEKLARSSVSDQYLNEHKTSDEYANRLIDFVVEYRDKILRNDVDALARNVLDMFKFTLKDSRNGFRAPFLTFYKKGDSKYFAVATVKLDDSVTDTDDGISRFPVIGYEQKFLDQVSNNMLDAQSGLDEFCNYVNKVCSAEK